MIDVLKGIKILKKSLVLFFAFLGVNQLFAIGKMELVNIRTLDVDSVETLNILYYSDNLVFDNIVLLESKNNNLVLKEYMTRNSPDYFANIENSHGIITISNGERPQFMITRIEIYIPKTFTNNLFVNLRRGNITVNNFTGNGTFDIESGNIILTVNSITGDLYLSNNSGNINLKMEGNLSFILDAEVRSGNITAPNLSKQGNTSIQHIMGPDPIYTIYAKIGSGNINVK